MVRLCSQLEEARQYQEAVSRQTVEELIFSIRRRRLIPTPLQTTLAKLFIPPAGSALIPAIREQATVLTPYLQMEQSLKTARQPPCPPIPCLIYCKGR